MNDLPRARTDETIVEQEANILNVSGIYKNIGNTPVLENISFVTGRGECFGILGENGSGKTTLLRIIAGLVFPTEGEVMVCGNNPHRSPVAAHSAMSALIGIPAFYSHLSGIKNLEVFWSKPSKPDRRHIMELLHLVGLADDGEKKTGAYSRGMLQRLGIALAILNDRPLLLLDEPTQGVDEYWVSRLRDLVTDMATGGKTFIITSHDLDFVLHLCQRVLILDHGRQAYCGEFQRIAEYPYYFHLRTEPEERVLMILRKLPFVHGATSISDGYILTIKEEMAPALLDTLIRADCSVTEFSKRRYSVGDLVTQFNEKGGNGGN